MANHPAPPLALLPGDGGELERMVRSSSIRSGLSMRARIVLLAAEGKSNQEIAQMVGTSRLTVVKWRSRYQQRGLAGLADAERSERPVTVDSARTITATLEPPKTLG